MDDEDSAKRPALTFLSEMIWGARMIIRKRTLKSMRVNPLCLVPSSPSPAILKCQTPGKLLLV
ncbi:hypothetical protein K443DRAFT_679155 [Laccaria amethystina LaAM-08-1]|uniref:Uncharacterized protein n=1 Tax=Laccaria amethystina LaAM-08-1 TaxID=1095629 RepID=A0A0C9X688_9AGAR|nr:hypothetical protein K443DRAFT_679155 [Laccaria amethystina LaAM-08-1]